MHATATANTTATSVIKNRKRINKERAAGARATGRTRARERTAQQK